MALSHSPKIVTDGLVLCLDAANPRSYPGSGTTWFDLSGKGNHLQLNNNIFFSSEERCFIFDGTDDYALIDTQILKPDNVTMIAIAKNTDASQFVSFIGGCGNTGYNGYWLGISGSNYNFSAGNGNYYLEDNTRAPQISIKSRTTDIEHLSGTFDGFTIKTYDGGDNINSITHFNPGVLDYSGLGNGFVLGSIEGFNASRFWTGNIYSIFVYNRALSEAEIKQNYNAYRDRYGI